MALRKLSSLLLVAQLLLVVVGGASAIVARGTQLYTTGYFPQIDCSPAPMATSTGSNGTAFRANLLTLLASLPDQAAPTGFASMQAGAGGRAPGGDDDDRAFARGLLPRRLHAVAMAANASLPPLLTFAQSFGPKTRRGRAPWLSGCDNLDPTFLDLANGALSALAAAAANPVGVGADDAGGDAGVRRRRQHGAGGERAGAVRGGPRAGGLRAVPAGLGASDAEMLLERMGAGRERRCRAELRLRAPSSPCTWPLRRQALVEELSVRLPSPLEQQR
ncbi:hypothetical protein OsJ_03650 [Oryza sativa Japonica Group]|uniref:Uncharacterized protein n=1 Tax=Oryza sativa subsp. japonica TaxID=39947 RepID=A2ZYD0_ORYSJ|nr:hypothetical protein OsJ_03650 [Oryza sativa Japonica Group]